ncbi:ribonuclease HII [Kocuria sp.]|uniref:ribonuclease HII n=1 Tax=Kocuria sp. TaxID=1871328 RepID=UPI0026DB76AE|nr:ribonuclease HII [Kocuria sp.]MDO4918490.1 ribonuclease HII [Kocuria sp.]
MSSVRAAAPDLRLETELARNGARLVAGMDEVGRGALAGPASVGVVVLDVPALLGARPSAEPPNSPALEGRVTAAGASTSAASVSEAAARTTPPGLPAASAPRGLSAASTTGGRRSARSPRAASSPWDGVRDSKALSPARREALAAAIPGWTAATAVGHAAPGEIDALGITAALRLAGLRALAGVRRQGVPVDALILDGSHNWLAAAPVLGQEADPTELPPVVRTLVKADAQCVSVAAASILAKVERDALMTDLARDHPQYAWEANKGYGSATHRDALLVHGATEHHRRSWNLGPGVV